MEKKLENTKIRFISDLTHFQKVIKLTQENPNDMDLGKIVRALVAEYELESKKPPFTDDYIQ